MYGMRRWSDAFTHRQLLALTTLSDLVTEARAKVIADGASPEYADAVATYLGLAVSRNTDYSSSICSWHSGRDTARNVFARQAIPMVWDFVESNLLSGLSGSYASQINWIAGVIESLVPRATARAIQADAATRDYDGMVISTDPPYYDNIGYADLSDFFYVWLRRTLREVHPDLLATLLVPKAEELIASPSRHDGKAGAKRFFEDGFRNVFARARKAASNEYPITVYYAYKQAETDASGQASTGWETLLQGMIGAGWEITATWPLRSELGNRMIASGTNALASSIVLSLRPRPDNAPKTDRRGYLDALREELPTKLRDLQHGAVAPVDLAQAAIGPGMAVFSRYERVVEPSGLPVSVREALRLINGVLAEVLSDQEGDFDTDTRWCVKWFETHGFERAGYGEAETLAAAYNTSVKGLDRSGAVYAKAGEVRLQTTAELPRAYRPERDEHITLWEVAMHLVKALDESGLAEAGRILDGASMRVDVEAVKELAYLVFSLAEKRSMVQVAGMFNALVTSWPEVTAAAKAHASAAPKATEQAMLALDDELCDSGGIAWL
jgi:putative DNA methylase